MLSGVSVDRPENVTNRDFGELDIKSGDKTEPLLDTQGQGPAEIHFYLPNIFPLAFRGAEVEISFLPEFALAYDHESERNRNLRQGFVVVDIGDRSHA